VALGHRSAFVLVVGVGGALMALVRGRWGLGGAREDKMKLKGWLCVTSPARRVLNAPTPITHHFNSISFRVCVYSRGRK
jgi:hypothetical protein